MINRKTVFVVGAGASKDFGFPIGRELRTEISSLLAPDRVDDGVREAFQLHDYANFSQYMASAHLLSRSVAAYRSIDRAMAFGTEDDEMAERMRMAGKLAISRVILDRESKCALYSRRNSTFSLEQFESTWLGELFILMQEHADPRRPEKIFENVSFICFNYDRCIEQFFYWALRETHHCNADRAANLVQHLKIYHPFGTVGSLPWGGSSGAEPCEFGWGATGYDLLKCAKSLRTMGYTPPEEELSPWLKEIERAKRLVFLGFGFDPANLALIKPPAGSRARVFATMYDVSPPAQALNESAIRKFVSGQHPASPQLDIAPVECAKFMTQYADHLTL